METYESVTANSNLAELGKPLGPLLLGEKLRNLLKEAFEILALRTRLGNGAAAEQIDGVALVGTLCALLELEVEGTLMETHPPVVSLVASKTSAVDAALLASTETNDLTVKSVADRVGLSVLESNGSNGKVTKSRFGKAAILGGDDGAEGGRRDFGIVAVLRQVDAVDGASLHRRRLKLRVHLENKVLAALLLLENLKSFRLVAGGNDTVRNLPGNDFSSRDVDLIRESDHVAKAGHAVGTTSPGVSLSEAGLLDSLNVIDHVHLPLGLRKRNADGGTSRRDVLEGGSSGEVQSVPKFLYQRPGVQGIKKVDIARSTAEDLERKVAITDEGSGGLLVGVGTIAQGGKLSAIASVLLTEEVGDGSVVVGSVGEGLQSVKLPLLLGNLTLLLEFGEEVVVVLRVRQDGDPAVILGGSTEQGDAANVDVLDSLGDGYVDLGNGLLEGVAGRDTISNLWSWNGGGEMRTDCRCRSQSS